MDPVCFGFFVLLILLTAITILGRWILGPLDRAARRRKGPTQFTVVDFLCLLFLVQLPLGLAQLTVLGRGSAEPRAATILFIAGCVVGGMMWLGSIKQLSAAGVTKTSHRCVFLAVVLPVTFLGAIATMICCIALIASLSSPAARPSAFFVPLFIMAGLLVAFWAAAQATRWIVEQSEVDARRSSPDVPVAQITDRSDRGPT
jgi:hypothetical protein